MENDANCLALSEGRSTVRPAGASSCSPSSSAPASAAASLSTGKVVTGRNRIAGEWGHNPLPWPQRRRTAGPACYCGKTGCIETFSQRRRDFPRLPARTDATHAGGPRYRGGGSRARPTRGSDARHLSGPAGARPRVRRQHRRSGRDRARRRPLQHRRDLRGPARTQVARYAFSDLLATRVDRARHGDSSGVRGAAWLWPCRKRAKRSERGAAFGVLPTPRAG